MAKGTKNGATKSPLPLEKTRDNPPLLFVFLLLPLFYGGYYNYTVFGVGLALVGLLAYGLLRDKVLTLPTGWEGLALLGLLLGNGLALFTCVSVGMTLVGFLRVAVWGLLALYVATYTQAERQSILVALSYEGALLSLATTLFFCYESSQGVVDANGRIDGLFEYANTWGLFLLICLIVLVTKEVRHPVDWVAMPVLVTGIYLSGSRGIFLLLFPLALGYFGWMIWKKKQYKPVLIGLVALVGLAVLVNLVTDGLLLSRLQAIALTSSSVNGRLLYYLDGLAMIWDTPLGVGRGGYLYIQPLYQTGVYTLQYIHNGYLQQALDGGILAGLSMVALVLCCLFQKGIPLGNRLIVLAIGLHMCIDFDAECGSCSFS